MESDQYHVMPQQKHIGSRTHKDVKAGKIIRIDDDGFENFSDYWTDPDTPQSPSSVHILKHSLHADDRKNQTESLLAQEHESSATLSPFTPSQDEFINLEVNSKSGISTALCRQPSDAKSQTVHSAELEVVETVTKEQSLTADNSDKIKTITGNEHPVESDDITVTVEVPRMVTKHKSKIAVWMKGARAKTVEKDGDESDATKRSKSSDVAATSSCKRRVAISQDPLAEEVTVTKDKSRHGSEKCPEQSIMGSKAVINPVVVLHALSPRCSVVPGTASLTCASFPLNMKGDVAGTLSRPTTGLPSAAVGQTSPEIVRPTRKRLTYSTESPESSEIVERTQQSDFVRLEVNGIASSRLSSTDKRNETAVMSLQSLKVAETGNTEPEVSQNCKAICEEFPVVTRERKSNCRVAMNPKHITSSYSSSCVTNVVASVGRSLPLQRAKDTSQSKAFSVEAEEVFHKDDEKQIPAEKEIEVDSLQDSETDTEADNEVIRNGDCFDLFDKTSSSLAPVLDIVREDDDLVADGNDENLISLASRTREGQEGDHSDADDGNDDADDDDFQMVPLSQVNTIKLNYNVRDIKVGSKKLTKAAKPKARSNLAGAVYNCNLPDTVDASEHTLVEEQNESPTVLERPDGIKSRTRHISNSKANKLSKVRKEGFVQNVRNNKTSSETTRKQDEAVSVDTAKNIVKNRPKAGNGYKRMKESQPPDILRKRRKRTRSSNCYVSEQEDEDLSSEKVNRHSSRTVLSQSIGETEEEEEDMPDALILTKESRKSVIPLERERRPVEETKEKKEDQKTPGRKTNTVKKVVDTGQKRKSIPSSENNIKESLTDAFKKNKRTKGKNKRIVKPQIVPERKGKQSKGKRTEKPTALDPVSINELVTGSDYSRKKDNAVLKEDQARDSEHLMITRGQTSMEATDGTIVSDPRQRSMLDDVSNIEPAKTHIGRNLVQYISTPKTKRRSSRHAAAVANQESSLLHKGKQKKISSVSRQSLVGKQTERQPSAHTEDDLPDAQNSSDLSSDDSPGKRKLRKSRTLPEEPLVVTIPNGVEDKEAARINQLNVTKTPPIRLSVPSRLHYFDGTISSKKTGKQKLRKIYPPEGNNACGMRRSRRTRVKALDWFRNERIHYERRESGFVVAGIYSPKIESDLGVDEKFVKKMNCKEKHPEKKRHAERRNLSIHADLSHSLLPKTPSEIKVVNPQTQEEVFVDCVKTLDQAKMVGVSGKAPNDDEPLLLCKPIRQKTFASGTLIIRPLQIKKMQFVQNDTMLFHVIHGKVEVTIHQTNFVVESRDKFFVPVGNSYSIRNLRNEDAELDFTQIKS